MMKKRNKRGDWRQARKPFLSDLPEVDADIPYRVNLVMLGMAADQVAQSACQSAAARSLVARPPQEKEETRAAGGDFLAEVFSAASETAAGEERAVDERRVLDADNDRCLCKVSGGPFASVNLAKLVFTRAAPDANLPTYASQFDALGTIMVITLVVAGSVLGEDPAAAVQDQLRALKELVDLLRVGIPRKLRPVRAVLLCSLDMDSSPSELCGVQTGWQDIISEFEEEHGKLWTFGPVDASDREEVHATFAQMASAHVNIPAAASVVLPEDTDASWLPGELMASSFSALEASQTLQAVRLASQEIRQQIARVADGEEGLITVPEASWSTAPPPSEPDVSSQTLTSSFSASEASCLGVRLPGERSTAPSFPVLEAPQMQRLPTSRCRSECSQKQRGTFQDLLPVMVNTSPSLPSSQASLPSQSVLSEEEEAFLGAPARDAERLARLIDRASAAMGKLPASGRPPWTEAGSRPAASRHP